MPTHRWAAWCWGSACDWGLHAAAGDRGSSQGEAWEQQSIK